MPNYDVHVLSGIVSYPIAVAIAGFLSTLGIPFSLTPMALVLGYALYVLGADLPDMDHPNALIHRGTKPIVAVAVGSAVFLRLEGSIKVGEPWVNLSLSWLGAAFSGAIAWYGFTAIMPSHRGVVHSLLFAAIYGLLSYLLIEFGLGMSTGEALFAGFAAFAGYTLHLILDREVSLI